MPRIVNLMILVCAVFLTSCSHVNYLREAQDTFNQAAASDNLYRYGDSMVTEINDLPAAGPISASAGYAATVTAVEALKNDYAEKKRLQADGLYGYALILESLAYWRLEKWEQAVSTAEEAQATGDLGSRDLALMQALPGLIKNDQAFAKLARLANDGTSLTCTTSPNPSSSHSKWDLKLDDDTSLELHCRHDVINIRDQLGGALCDVDTARSKAPSGHPVRDYLALSQLATVANIRTMCDAAKYPGAPPKFSSSCADETIRVGKCVAGGLYGNDPDAIVSAIVKDFCKGRPLQKSGLVWDLLSKSGIDKTQLEKACPELAS